MKKRFLGLSILILAIISCFCLSGCLGGILDKIKGNKVNNDVCGIWYYDGILEGGDTNFGDRLGYESLQYGASFNPPEDPVREGYTFAGWDYDLTLPVPSQNGLVVLATWTANEYKIKFVGDDMSEIDEVTVTYDSVIGELPTVEQDRYGYTFIGWQIDKIVNKNNVILTEQTKYTYAEDLVATAKWERHFEYALSSDKTYYTASNLTYDADHLQVLAEYEGKPVTTLVASSNKKSNATQITIPASITFMRVECFSSSTNKLERVNYLGTIDDWAKINSLSLYPHYNPLYYAKEFYVNGEKVVDAVVSSPTINGSTFTGSAIKTLTLTNTVTTISRFEGLTADVIFASDSPITTIPTECFENYSGKKVVLPANLQTIEYGAFYMCKNLYSITIPENVTLIRDNAFSGCIKLVEVINKSNLNLVMGNDGNGSIAYYAKRILTTEPATSNFITLDGYEDLLFYNGENLYYLMAYSGNGGVVQLPNGVNGKNYVITNNAFSETDITEVYADGGVVGIGEAAFASCEKLTKVVLNENSSLTGTPSNKESVMGNYAFEWCTALKEITIPKTITVIYSFSSNGATEIEKINYNGTVDTWVNLNFQSNSILSYADLYIGGEKLVNAEINATNVNERAFLNYKGLVSVHFGENVQVIQRNAFNGCTNLDQITVASNNIKYKAVTNCLISKNYPNEIMMGCNGSVIPSDGSITKIQTDAFKYAIGLTEITLHKNITNISNSFKNCTALTKVDYIGTPSDWVKIDFSSAQANPLYNAKNLYFNGEVIKNIDVSGAGNINDYVFAYLENVETIKVSINQSGTNIGQEVFAYCKADVELVCDLVSGALNIPLKDYLFENFKGSKLTLPNGIASLGSYVFRECTAEIIWKGTPKITIINDYSYDYYLGATVDIPDSVVTIKSGAFTSCENLIRVKLGANVEVIENGAFSDYYKIKEVVNNSNLTITAGATDNGGIAQYAEYVHTGGSTNKYIWAGDFVYLRDNNSVTLVKYVGEATEVVLPDDVYGDNYVLATKAFYGHDGITSIVIGAGCKEIEKEAFYSCNNLTSVVIGAGVTKIGEDAFEDCYELESITLVNTSGWKYGELAFSAEELADPVNVANYLTSQFKGEWTRTAG